MKKKKGVEFHVFYSESSLVICFIYSCVCVLVAGPSLHPPFPFGNYRFVFEVYSIITYMRKESETEWIYVQLNHFVIHLKITQPYKSIIFQYKIKIKFFKKECLHLSNSKLIFYTPK